jgi:DNA-binding transcriptional LysR family regulator
MNWQTISFDWNQVRAFLATAEEGSLSAAARALKSTQPTLSRQISALEEALQVTLFIRTARGLILSETGNQLLEHVQMMGDAANHISLIASKQSQQVSGLVCVTATDLLSATILPRICMELRKLAPNIEIKIIADNSLRDLTRREADIAIRHIRPSQPDLIARHITDYSASLFAATTYLKTKGYPRNLRDLADHAFIGSDNIEELFTILRERNIQLRADNIIASSNSGVVIWEMLKAGLGITLMPDMLGNQMDNVEKVLPSIPHIDFPVWLVTHQELHTNRRIRLVFDLLAKALLTPEKYS